MRIGVIGVGAIGGWIGARLAGAGHSLSCVARGETRAAIAAHGLRLDADGVTTAWPVAVSDDATALGVQDLVVIAVKGPALAAAAEAAQPLIGPDTLILPTLNGVPWWLLGADAPPLDAVDPGGRIAALLPIERVIGCVVHATSIGVAPGHVALKRADRLLVGEPLGGGSARIDDLVATLGAAGLPAEARPDIRRDIWYKLLGNMTMNPISALTRAETGPILDDPLVARFAIAVMAEARAIGARIGCTIDETPEMRMATTRKLGSFPTSMLQDVAAGRTLELDALLAAPVEIGRRLGEPVAAMEALLGLTRLFARTAGLYPGVD